MRVGARLASVLLAIGCVATVLVGLDRVVAWTDLGYRAARARPSEDRWLVRPEFRVHVVTNALGFREPRLPSPKRAGVVRVVALGDSFTQGYGVAENEAYPRQLEARLDARDHGHRYDVINLGVPGTSPRDYLGHLRDPGLGYSPDLVVVGVMANDVQDVMIQRRFGVQFAVQVLRDVQRELADGRPLWRRAPARLLPALYPFVWTRVDAIRQAFATSASPRTAAAGTAEPAPARPALAPERWRDVVLELGERFGRRSEVARALETAPAETIATVAPVATGAVPVDSDAGVEGWERILALVQPRLFADAVLLPPAYDGAWAATEAALASIVRLARGEGSDVVLVYVPAIHQVTTAGRASLERAGFAWDPRTLTDSTLPDRLRRFGEAEGVPVVDLLPVLRAHAGAALYFPEDGHWTPAGHALAADTIAAAVAPLLMQRAAPGSGA